MQEAREYWEFHIREKEKVEQISMDLDDSLKRVKKSISCVKSIITKYVKQKTKEVDDKILCKEKELDSAGLFAKGKIKKEIKALQTMKENYDEESGFDNYISEELTKKETLEKKKASIEEFLAGIKNLEKDISSSRQKYYFDLVNAPEEEQTEFLLSLKK